MSRSMIELSVDDDALAEVDRLVAEGVFPDRSEAFEDALRERLRAMRKRRLARECARLDSAEEVAAAEEVLAGEVEWPAY
jgi:metal-responsive CopG/Arc/MetJ family transcriptional regulator